MLYAFVNVNLYVLAMQLVPHANILVYHTISCIDDMVISHGHWIINSHVPLG